MTLLSVIVPIPAFPGSLPEKILALPWHCPEVEWILSGLSPNQTIQPLPSHPNVQILIPPQSLSLGAARCQGVAAATGLWLAFWDPGQDWLIDGLERRLALVQQGQAQAYCGTQGLIGNNPLCPASLLAQTMRSPLSYFSALLIQRAWLTQVGGLDPELNHYQAWDSLIRLAQHGEVRVLDEPWCVFTTRRAAEDPVRLAWEYEQVVYKHVLAMVGNIGWRETARQFSLASHGHRHAGNLWGWGRCALIGHGMRFLRFPASVLGLDLR